MTDPFRIVDQAGVDRVDTWCDQHPDADGEIALTVAAGCMPNLHLVASVHGFEVRATVVDQHWTAVTLVRSPDTPVSYDPR